MVVSEVNEQYADLCVELYLNDTTIGMLLVYHNWLDVKLDYGRHLQEIHLNVRVPVATDTLSYI